MEERERKKNAQGCVKYGSLWVSVLKTIVLKYLILDVSCHSPLLSSEEPQVQFIFESLCPRSQPVTDWAKCVMYFPFQSSLLM